MNQIYVYTQIIVSGDNTLVIANQLEDNTEDFNALGVKIGDVVVNVDTNQTAEVEAKINFFIFAAEHAFRIAIEASKLILYTFSGLLIDKNISAQAAK